MRSKSAFSMKGLVTSRRAVAAASCVASLATRVLWCTCTARYNTDKTTAAEPISCEMALIASQFIPRFIPRASDCLLLRLVSDFQNNFSARVTRRDLLLRLFRFRKRKRLGNNYFDFAFVDQFANLCQLT